MDGNNHFTFAAGDRVYAVLRPGFPLGTVIKLMDGNYVLVRWDGDVLETADRRNLAKVPPQAADDGSDND